MSQYDFGGYVTKNDLQCSDGRVIRHGAFEGCNGKRVPLVWNHRHESVDNVLGYADLEVRHDGVYGHASFNETDSGKKAKELLRHGDIISMSIMANQLKQRGQEVIHGVIREVSLVLAGANPGAVIDNLNLVHSDGSFDILDDEACIQLMQGIELSHADKAEEEEEEVVEETEETTEEEPQEEEKPEAEASDDDKTVQDVLDTFTEEQKTLLYALIGAAAQQAEGGEEIEHADVPDMEAAEDIDLGGKTPEEVWNSMNEEQQTVALALIGQALQEGVPQDEEVEEEETVEETEEVEHSSESEAFMSRNIFEAPVDETNTLSHAEVAAIFDDARKGNRSLKDTCLEHGITNIENLFPEAQAVNAQPAQITRRMEWVSGVLAGVHKSPFSKVKSTAVNMTEDQARAKGYVKGNKKVEEQIAALKRVTEPTTIYKLQKLDRDDVIDITDFDVVAFMKAEMRVMLDEELARAILVGDGRTAVDNDKIKEDKIRPIWTDVETYTVHSTITGDLEKDPKATAKAFIDEAIRARKNYKGSGTPTLYVGTNLLTEMRLLRDELGYRLYKNDQELADELRVSKIVEIEAFDGLTRDADTEKKTFGGLIVNLADYNVGATRGGEVNLFDDFDLDYNKLEFLIETRCSGALVVPMSALSIDIVAAKN